MAKYTDEQIKREIPEAKSLRWLAINFPKIEKPKNDVDRMQNCIHNYCSNAANLIDRQEAEIERLRRENAEYPTRVLCDKGLIFTKSLAEYDELINDISAEAIKEFWNSRPEYRNEQCEGKEEYNKGWNACLNEFFGIRNNLVKEMVGESK